MAKNKSKNQIIKTVSLKVLLPFFSFSVLCVAFFHFLFFGRAYPNLFIADYYAGGLCENEILANLNLLYTPPEELNLAYEDRVFTIPLDDLNFSFKHSLTAKQAYQKMRSGNFLFKVFSPLSSIFSKITIPLNFSFNNDALSEHLETISQKTAAEASYPLVEYINGEIIVDRGKPGKYLDKEKLTETITQAFSRGQFSSIAISSEIIDPTIDDNQANILKLRANNILNKKLLLTFENDEYTYTKGDLLPLLDVTYEYNDKELDNIINSLAEKFERLPQNPIFNFADGVVKEFSPAKDGINIKKDTLKEEIKKALNWLEKNPDTSTSINIPVVKTPPDYQTEDVNNMGIKELIGRGKSRFTGSIASRIHNISLASAKFNGVLVKPNETFSFNQVLGDVSPQTGYQQAYIIKEGATILGDGGGVCQVSTTLFRAVLNAGLPILERQAHAYRVSYYEQDSSPGLDATVYEPHPDLKFKNDTPGHLLIQTAVYKNTSTLIFEIYGTADGRVATTTKPTVSDVTPPPEDLYTDDPTLPVGSVKQIDWKAWGAKVKFNYEVKRNGETIYTKTFYSNYQPWQAKFLRGTGSL